MYFALFDTNPIPGPQTAQFTMSLSYSHNIILIGLACRTGHFNCSDYDRKISGTHGFNLKLT